MDNTELQKMTEVTNLASGMKKPKKKGNPDALRTDAEKELAEQPAESTAEENSAPDKLIHELRVHQIELEMQNEERRKAHLALEESLDKYVDLHEFAPVDYLTLTKKALIEEVNLTAASLLGVDRRILIKGRIRKYIVAEDIEDWDRFFISVLRSPEKLICDTRLLKGDGSRFPARVESLLIEREKKDPVVHVAISDITATTTMQEQIAANEERLKALLHNASDIIRILNREGRIVFDSTASERVLGYPPGFTIGKSPSEFIHPDDIPIVKREIARVFEKTNTGVPTEFRLRKADGSYICVESVGKNMFGVPVLMVL